MFLYASQQLCPVKGKMKLISMCVLSAKIKMATYNVALNITKLTGIVSKPWYLGVK